jgi:hypothetical protein
MDPHPEGSRVQPAAHVQPRRRGPAIAIVLVVLAVAAVGAYFLLKPDSDDGPPQRRVVASFSGSGNDTTQTFRVTKPWRIEWRNAGKRFAIAITGDRDFGTVVEREKPGAGVTTAEVAGTFRLVVKAKGAWSAKVLQED